MILHINKKIDNDCIFNIIRDLYINNYIEIPDVSKVVQYPREIYNNTRFTDDYLKNVAFDINPSNYVITEDHYNYLLKRHYGNNTEKLNYCLQNLFKLDLSLIRTT